MNKKRWEHSRWIRVSVKVGHWGNETRCGFWWQFSLDAHVLWFVMVAWVCWSDVTVEFIQVWPGRGTQATNGGATSERSEDIVFVPEALLALGKGGLCWSWKMPRAGCSGSRAVQPALEKLHLFPIKGCVPHVVQYHFRRICLHVSCLFASWWFLEHLSRF